MKRVPPYISYMTFIAGWNKVTNLAIKTSCFPYNKTFPLRENRPQLSPNESFQIALYRLNVPYSNFWEL